jgi:glycosyltransferase involved in cell wall biosynthesis
MLRASIIITSYNHANYLATCLESALNQTYENTEVVVIENGSTDDSPNILRGFAGHPRLRTIYHAKNASPNIRLNEAIRFSTGDFISILYSDDLYLPDKIERQMRIFESLPADYGVVHSPGYRLDVDTGGKWLDDVLPLSGWVLHDVLTKSNLYFNPIASLAKRACYEKYPFDEEFFIEGEGIMTRFGLSFQFKFDPEPTVIMRDHGGNMGRSVKRTAEIGARWWEKFGKDPEFPESERAALEERIASHYRYSAWSGVRVVEDGAWARKMALYGMARSPQLMRDPKVLGALALSFVPDAGLRLINNGVRRFWGKKGHDNYVPDYAPNDPKNSI